MAFLSLHRASAISAAPIRRSNGDDTREKLGRRELLKKAGLLSAGALAFAASNKSAMAASSTGSLVGLWDMTVVATTGSVYRYKYTIGADTFTAVGSVDQGYYNSLYSATLGAYVEIGSNTYRYREHGFTYTRGGMLSGTFETTGEFVLDGSGNQFTGTYLFKQYKLTGETVLTESGTLTATRLAV